MFIIANGNGKVIECINNIFDKTLFEGEYINGEKNGKEKKFNSYNELIFEGQYLNGKKHGKIIEYDYSTKYVSEYLNGEKNGYCQEYYNEKLEFEGEYLNGKRWEGIIYNKEENLEFQIKNGNGK